MCADDVSKGGVVTRVGMGMGWGDGGLAGVGGSLERRWGLGGYVACLLEREWAENVAIWVRSGKTKKSGKSGKSSISCESDIFLTEVAIVAQ